MVGPLVVECLKTLLLFFMHYLYYIVTVLYPSTISLFISLNVLACLTKPEIFSVVEPGK